MFIVLLKLTERKSQAEPFLQGHKDWIRQGFADKAFVLAGSLQAGVGGAILATSASVAELRQRLDADPFVREGIVIPEIHEVTPSVLDDRIAQVFA